MGILYCLYEPILKERDDSKLISDLHLYLDSMEFRPDTIRISGKRGSGLERPIISADQFALSKKSVIRFFVNNSYIDDPYTLGFAEYARRDVLGGYIIIYLKEADFSRAIQPLTETPDLVCGKYGFARPWDDLSGDPWGYAFGVIKKKHINDVGEISDEEQEIASWGSHIFYGQDKWSTGKIRDVFPVNVLSTRMSENFGKIISLVESDPHVFGEIRSGDNSAVWMPPYNSIKLVRSLMREHRFIFEHYDPVE